MPRPKGPTCRIIGIEDRGGAGEGRFRLRYVDDGRREARGFATEEGAKAGQRELEKLWAKRGGTTVGSTIDAWLADREAQGQSVQRYHRRWVPQMLEDLTHIPITGLTRDDVADRYKALADSKAGATAHLIHACVKLYCAYLVEARHLRTDLAADLPRRGVAKAGKPQIETQRELHAYRDELWRRAWAGDRVCLAVLVALYLGLRPGETQKLCGRHVDVDRRLVVPGTKTESSWRIIEVELADLWTLLEQTAAAVGPAAPLCRFTNPTVIKRIREVASAAGVLNADELVFQSMRGQASSIARANGAAIRAIADGLGQASEAVSRRHYVTAKADATGEQKAALTLLEGGRRG